ncbi:hypothetical protein BKP45_11665 [Anaerobacillus alkalidiazotrophicus]|uniref:Septation ring formation regulator EzrA n=1 Tax=Anaerobacillus alkalidiazotrophicus TaxID=472963 RepID=A0A1S2M513_9BACI|nr:septation ring formation regulator EzrA [Anaerobacillus alkalidiazotrophicus]OIJ18235.1 hypothetical protein BKP45_17380 [Anaerobacillus alkalidiazotrophicus]OIJ19714.1 hypothetical protein BKP45_11665 [Anaerobacillus alkalidiazotrophicus]
MQVVYGLLIITLAFIIYGVISRKKIYNEVDRLEAWKIQIMNKPVADEISKIKGLNMSGETETKFESWRNEWDDIITLKLPNLEEKLFDIEEAANKYRFVKAKNISIIIAEELTNIENSIQLMMADIKSLIQSEEENRQQIDEIRSFFNELKAHFSVNKGALGTTVNSFESRIKEIDKSFLFFEHATKEGNYFEASEILTMMKEEIAKEKWKIDETPKILVQIQKEIPSQIEELLLGIREMEEDGYILEHFSFKNDIQEIKKELKQLFNLVEEGDVEAVTSPVTGIYHIIDEIYDTLEQEVLAKQYVHYELYNINEETKSLHEQFLGLKNEVENVKLSYRIPEDDLKLTLKIEKQMKDQLNRLRVIEELVFGYKQSYIDIKKSIEEYKEELVDRKSTLENCQQTLNALRKDELKAKETLKELRGKIHQGQRIIKKSNIPGLPEEILYKLDEAQASLSEANDRMEKIPLVIQEVNNAMELALENVNEVYNLITATVEQALTTERVIQYGNRFRSNNAYIHEELNKAEESFRNYQYGDSLEIALTAIETVDPNVLEKISSYVMEKV